MIKVLAALSAIFVALAVILGALLASAQTSIDVPLEIAKAVLTLMTAVLITGVLSFVLSDRNARRARLEDRERVLTSALQNLKAGYERVQVARFYLTASRTASMLQEQISKVSESRTLLHLVQ